MALFDFIEPDAFTLNSKQSDDGVSSPKSVKAGAQILKPNKSLVNVVLDYAWTINPKSSRKDVPYIYMIERKLTNDVMIQQLVYNIKAAYEVGSGISKEIANLLQQTYGLSDSKITEINKIASQTQTDSESPYQGLYSLEDTGWNYIFPYFDKKNHDINGSWGLPSDSGGFINKIGGTINQGLAEVATSVNQIVSALGVSTGQSQVVRPGTYIEQAKQYKFSGGGPSYSIDFNLYNTGTIEDVIRNWELCFALMYNLLPNRRTKTVFDPPPLYEIFIPGVRRSPVSFIKGIKVDFLGATRLMDLDVINQSSFRTIVPDAYTIRIDIEDVLPESKNFMESMINEEKRVRVSSSTDISNRTYSVDENIETNGNNITHIDLNRSNNSSFTGTGVKTSVESFANENISEPVKNAQRSIQRTFKNINNISGGRF